jgi:hypothetical protein
MLLEFQNYSSYLTSPMEVLIFDMTLHYSATNSKTLTICFRSVLITTRTALQHYAYDAKTSSIAPTAKLDYAFHERDLENPVQWRM